MLIFPNQKWMANVANSSSGFLLKRLELEQGGLQYSRSVVDCTVLGEQFKEN